MWMQRTELGCFRRSVNTLNHSHEENATFSRHNNDAWPITVDVDFNHPSKGVVLRFLHCNTMFILPPLPTLSFLEGSHNAEHTLNFTFLRIHYLYKLFGITYRLISSSHMPPFIIHLYRYVDIILCFGGNPMLSR